MNSSRDSENTNSSSPSPWPPSVPRPWPPPPFGRGMRSPVLYSRLPGSTNSRSPPWPKLNEGSEMSLRGTCTTPPCSMSLKLRSPIIFLTAPWICDLYRRRNRARFTSLLPRLLGRRSMSWNMSLSLIACAWSRRLVHAQVPLGEQADLLLRVALGDHARDEVLMFLLFVGRGLRVERDHREQVLGVAEHLLLDHLAQLLVAVPRGV